jgi:hypothetical protein
MYLPDKQPINKVPIPGKNTFTKRIIIAIPIDTEG